MEVIRLDKNKKVENQSHTNLSSDASKKPKVVDEVPDPRGKYGGQVDGDLNDY